MLQSELARAVVHGHLPAILAEAALVAMAARNTRLGIDKRDLADAIAIDRHILYCALDQAETAADRVAAEIARTVRSMAKRRAPARAILAEAHQANGDENFALTEIQVEAVTAAELRRLIRDTQ